MNTYLCPVCIDGSNIGDPDFDEKHENIYTLDQLREHLENHSDDELIHYVLEEAQDPDNNYMKHEKGCQCPAHEDHSWLR